MLFFRRLAVGCAATLFSLVLVVFALSISVFFVLDKPDTLKNALRTSGLYGSFVDATVADKQQELGETLVLENPQLQAALKEAFTPAYLQSASEKNIDTTYDWLHGKIQKPDYSVDTSQPRAAFAANVKRLATERVAALPVCGPEVDMSVPPAAVLDMRCRPSNISVDEVASIISLHAENSYIIQDMAQSTVTIKDDNGQVLSDRFSFLPKIHTYFIWSLFIMPLALGLCVPALVFWSLSKRQGFKHIGRILLTTGLITIILAVAAAWLLGRGAEWLGGTNQVLVAIQGKLLEAGHLIGESLRNWLIGIGAGYVVVGIVALVGARIKNNQSLGYRSGIPAAGTMFDPAKGTRPTDEPADPDLKLK
jgi:hypothetical protein